MEQIDQEYQKRINKKITKLTNVVCELHIQNIESTSNFEWVILECGQIYEK